jgi:hypothetical protein
VFEFIPVDTPHSELEYINKVGKINSNTPFLSDLVVVKKYRKRGESINNLLDVLVSNKIKIHPGGSKTNFSLQEALNYKRFTKGVFLYVPLIKLYRIFNNRFVSESKLTNLAGNNKRVFWYGGFAHGRASLTNILFDLISFGKSLSKKFGYVNINLIVPEFIVDSVNYIRSQINYKIRELFVSGEGNLDEKIKSLLKSDKWNKWVNYYANGDKKLLVNNPSNKLYVKDKDFFIFLKQQKLMSVVDIVLNPTKEDLKPFISIEPKLGNYLGGDFGQNKYFKIYFDNCFHTRLMPN